LDINTPRQKITNQNTHLIIPNQKQNFNPSIINKKILKINQNGLQEFTLAMPHKKSIRNHRKSLIANQLAHRRRPPKIAPPFRRKSALPCRPSSPT